jgi:uncharacterized protein
LKRYALFLFLSGVSAMGHAQLRVGDVAVIAFNTDNPDSFEWVALRDMPSNTVIHFTNSSVSNNWFRWGDHLGRSVSPGPLTWTSTNLVRSGTVVSWISGTQRCWSVGVLSGGVPSLSTSGDQLFAYTGGIVSNSAGVAPWYGEHSSALMLLGLNFANAGWDNVTGGGTSTSFIPAGLCTNDGSAVHVGVQDNGYYAGPRTGTAAEVFAAIAVSSNWVTSEEYIDPALWPGAFRVTVPQGTVICVQ